MKINEIIIFYKVFENSILKMEQKIELLKKLATEYKIADEELGIACKGKYDPIASTILAYKSPTNNPNKSPADKCGMLLKQIVSIHGELINDYGMDADDVRNIWVHCLK